MLGDDVAAALPKLREHAESLMRDRFRGVRVAESVWDESTGQYTPSETVVYEGKGRIRSGTGVGYTRDVGAALTTVQGDELSLPILDTGHIDVGDVFELLESDKDPGMVGMQFRVTGIPARTDASARRFQVEHYR